MNLDARLDHAIEETFPTSDPISVTITKGPEPDSANQAAHSSSADDHQSQSERDSTEQVLDQVREALTTSQNKRLEEPMRYFIEVNTTSNKPESSTQRPSGTSAPASEP